MGSTQSGFRERSSRGSCKQKSEITAAFGQRNHALALLGRDNHIFNSFYGASILLAGALPGVVLSILAVRSASHLLYGSVSANSVAIIAASLVLALAGSIATLIPARRAAFADPLETLRGE